MKNIKILMVLLMFGAMVDATNTEICPGEYVNQIVVYNLGDVFQYCTDCLCNVTASSNSDNNRVISQSVDNDGYGLFSYKVESPPFNTGREYRFTYSCSSEAYGNGILTNIIYLKDCQDKPSASPSDSGNSSINFDDCSSTRGINRALCYIGNGANAIQMITSVIWRFITAGGKFIDGVITGIMEFFGGVISAFLSMLIIFKDLLILFTDFISNPRDTWYNTIWPFIQTSLIAILGINFMLFMLIEVIILFYAFSLGGEDLLKVMEITSRTNYNFISVLIKVLNGIFIIVMQLLHVLYAGIVGILRMIPIPK